MFSLIIPTFNEAGNIKPLLDRVIPVLEGLEFEVLFVDDDSSDDTALEVLNYRAVDERVRLIVRKRERGLSSAVIDGFKHAWGDVLGVMDADLSHDESILPDLVSAVMSGADLAVGTRVGVEGWPLKRKVISAGASFLAKLLLDCELSDPMSGFFVVKRSVFERVVDELNPLGFKILLELYQRAQPLDVVEVPFVFKDRVLGASKLSGSVMGDYLKQLLSLRSN